ncbi:MAG TPA: hypothetical protein VKZ97_05160, partial [Flavobacteriaceae bacterium]|nr:hypothetical protein [Flavobacteriaceae bacterium]
MKSITANDCIIHFNEVCYVSLNKHIEKNNFSKIFILVDTNTHTHCLPKFLEKLNTKSGIEII